jgi:hypothetical protein
MIAVMAAGTGNLDLFDTISLSTTLPHTLGFETTEESRAARQTNAPLN